jgi:hypothetical protein
MPANQQHVFTNSPRNSGAPHIALKSKYLPPRLLSFTLFKNGKESRYVTSKCSSIDTSIRSRLLGSWELVSYVAYSAENPKEFISPMGDDLKGIIMYTSDGYMSAHIQIPGQANFKANDLNGGTKDELAEAARRHFGYTGPFYLDESGPEPILKHHMSISSFPNWLGNTQRRVMKLHGDELVLGPEAPIEIMVISRHLNR